MDSVKKAVSFLLKQEISSLKDLLEESNPQLLTIEQQRLEAERLLKQLQK